MQRKEFIKTCGMACLGAAFLGIAFEGCSGSKMIAGTMDRSGLLVPLASFDLGTGSHRKYIVVQHEKLRYPVCVYRFDANTYTALLMRCTHQGAELQVFGDRLECPAHGSRFDNHGAVENGPADTSLRSFPVQILEDQLHITLS
ncbi:MAG: Rieske (2Fe-2S) protein [Bacteroidetes bacterium]|nr:Rieske (2Fe-2S) protein [Bacteroidota bacterium]